MKTENRTQLALLLLLASAILVVPPQRFARGEDDWDADRRTPDARAAAMGVGRLDLEANVNCWIYGRAGAGEAERQLQSMLNLRVHSLERAGGLSKAQAEKLRLAGGYDVACFRRKVDAIKQKVHGADINDLNGNDLNGKFQTIWQDIQPLQAQYNAGIFDETSLFAKVLQGMLRRNPSAAYEEEEHQRRRFAYRATIELAVTMFEAGAPLTDVQREKFLKVLFDNLEPPKRIGRRAEYVVFYQASKLDEKKLKPIFDDAQWRALQNAFGLSRGMARQLKSEGFVP